MQFRYITIRKQARFDQCLKAITNSQYQTVIGQKRLYRFIYFFVLQNISDEFTAAIRFISTGESANE